MAGSHGRYTFEEATYLFFQMCVAFPFPPAVSESPVAPESCLGMVRLFNFKHMYVVLNYCGLNLHFFND